MLKKISATLVAFVLALGLSLVIAPASAVADEQASPPTSTSPSDTPTQLVPSEPAADPAADSAPTPDPAPPADPAPSLAPPPGPAPQGPAPAQSRTFSQSAASSSYPTNPRLFGVALYVYKKVDAGAPAAWENSGPQRLLASRVDNTSEDANTWYTSISPSLLPADVCGAGWGVQQDKVSFTGSFAFPSTITPPDDNIGWPPLYDAQHQELSELVTVPACPPPSYPSCIPTSSVSYTYDATTNSGVITVPDPAGSTGELCTPFWVTATSWKYLGSSTWIQKLDQVQQLGKISTPGSYPYSAAVTCGQGDIYASFRGDDATLTPTSYLYGPDNPFNEHFLHEMGFSGPTPTYMQTKLGCNELSVAPTSAPASCTAQGGYSLPTVDHVRWLRDGTPVPAGDYTATTGSTVTITAIADETFVLPGGTQNPTTHEWSRSWTFHFPAATGCAVPQLLGSITAQCVNDVPILGYSVTLVDPDHQSTGDEAVLSLTDGTNTYVFDPALGTIHDGETLTGSRLWPGASVDGDGNPTGWPGWEFTGGSWQETTGNFAWTRADGLTAVISVNPELGVTVTYPPGDPSCMTRPPQDPPTLGLFPTNAQLSTQCTVDGRGVLTLGLVDGVSFFDDVNYFIDGVPATSATVYLNPGSYRVTVTTKNAADGLDGPTAWQLNVTGTGVCGELTTLALTGVESGYLAVIAGLLIAAGASIVVIRRVRPGA